MRQNLSQDFAVCIEDIYAKTMPFGMNACASAAQPVLRQPRVELQREDAKP